LISINLAIVNFLPFPALDGGKFIFLLIEAISRRKVSEKVENIIHTIGFAILIVLILLITWRDVAQYFLRKG
jgi:regulator of sigma E protease